MPLPYGHAGWQSSNGRAPARADRRLRQLLSKWVAVLQPTVAAPTRACLQCPRMVLPRRRVVRPTAAKTSTRSREKSPAGWLRVARPACHLSREISARSDPNSSIRERGKEPASPKDRTKRPMIEDHPELFVTAAPVAGALIFPFFSRATIPLFAISIGQIGTASASVNPGRFRLFLAVGRWTAEGNRQRLP